MMLEIVSKSKSESMVSMKASSMGVMISPTVFLRISSTPEMMLTSSLSRSLWSFVTFTSSFNLWKFQKFKYWLYDLTWHDRAYLPIVVGSDFLSEQIIQDFRCRIRQRKCEDHDSFCYVDRLRTNSQSMSWTNSLEINRKSQLENDLMPQWPKLKVEYLRCDLSKDDNQQRRTNNSNQSTGETV